MKTRLSLHLLVMLLAIGSDGFSQSTKPDVLVKTDNTRFSCRIIGIDPTTIRYRKLNQKNSLSISKTSVHKIIYASGVVRIFSKLHTAPPPAIEKTEPLSNEAKKKEGYTIQFKTGRRIRVTSIVTGGDKKTISYRENANTPLVRISTTDVDFVENPDGTRQSVIPTPVVTDEVMMADSNDTSPMIEAQLPPQQKSSSVSKKIALQFNGLGTYMLGSEVWTSLTAGYGHNFGVGGSVQFDYRVAKPVSVGVELGYLAWTTQVDLVEAPGNPPYYSYRTRTALPFALGHVRVKAGNNFYLMPQAGISQLQLTISDANSSTSYSSMQTLYGGTVGYLINPNGKINLDIGLFYRAVSGSETMGTSVGVEPMQYAGIRLGLGFSL